MQLLRLEVKNWCQHKYRVCTFTRGLVAIVGKIGSGKSNLLGAICWLLTGENPNAGVKADNVAQLASPDEPAFATLEFEHSGHVVVVTRHLLPEKEQATLLVDGNEAARGDKAVTAYIEKLLGIDSKFISRFVIVAQNEIFAFIEDGAAEVDRFFQKLFGTAVAEKCQDVIGKHLNKLTIPEVIETSNQLITRLDELNVQLNALDIEIAKLPSLESFLAIQQTQQKVIQDWERRTRLVAELATAEKSTEIHEQQLQDATRELAQYDSDLEALRKALGGDQAAHSTAKIALGHWANYKHLSTAKEKTQNRINEIVTLRAATQAPAAPAADVIDVAVKQEMATIAELTRLEKFVSTFATDGVAECPTCHTSAKDLKKAVEQAQRSIVELNALRKKQNAEVQAAYTAKQAYDVWAQQDLNLAAEEKQLRESMALFSNVQMPELSEEESAKIVMDFENFQKAELGILPLAQAAKEKRAALSGGLSAAKQQYENLQAQIADIKVTQAEAHMATTVLQNLSQQCVKRQELERQHAELKFSCDNINQQYLTAKENEQKAERMRDWSAVATSAKDALKAAPRIVAARNLKRLEAAINELLQVFGVDFFVRAANDESPTFIAEFFDGRKQPAKRLSYGQKTVLALAFRVAVNALFAEEIGLLALDEPTAYLDQQRIKALAPVLEKLRELSTARGLQCLLVTHETSLAHLFESAVELDVQ
jgi:DNA repair exonuclease SbcCD ATPase subunit